MLSSHGVQLRRSLRIPLSIIVWYICCDSATSRKESDHVALSSETFNEVLTSEDGASTCVLRTGSRYHMQGRWNQTRNLKTTEESCLTWKFFDVFGCCGDKPGTDKVFCDGALTRERAVRELLLAFADKRVTLMGDSLTRQIYGALVMMMKATGVELQPVLTSQPHNTLLNSTRIYIPSINATFRYAAVYSFAAVEESVLQMKKSKEKYRMDHAKVLMYIRQSDVIVCNIGQHYSKDSAFQEREMAYVQLVAREEAIARRENGESPLHWIWRYTLPQHFTTATGTGDWNDKIKGASQCMPTKSDWAHGSNSLMDLVRNSDATFPTAVIDTNSLLQDAHAFHSPRTDLSFADCTHYCFSDAVFAPIAMLHAKAIQGMRLLQ